MSMWRNWMTDKHWEGLAALQKVSPFDSPNIVDHMIQNHREWEQFILGKQKSPRMPGPYERYNVESDNNSYHTILNKSKDSKESRTGSKERNQKQRATKKRTVSITNEQMDFKESEEVDLDKLFNAEDSEFRIISSDDEQDDKSSKRKPSQMNLSSATSEHTT